MLKKGIAIITAIILALPFLGISTYAMEFDLPVPTAYNRAISSAAPSDYKYANIYRLYYENNEFDFLRSSSFTHGFHYYVNKSIVWGLGSYYAESATDYHITLDPFDNTKTYFRLSTNNSNVSNSLCFVSLLYEDIVIPAQADNYLKITFNMHTNFDLNNMSWSGYPSEFESFVNEYTKAQYLCGFVYRTPESGYEWSLPTSHMVPSAVTVRDVGTTITNQAYSGDNMEYTFYFNVSGGFLSDLLSFEGVGLLIRFPFWFGPNADNGVRVLGNAFFPSSYEIISPNDYSQELENIENAVTTVNSSVLQVYDALTNNPDTVGDTIIITGFDNSISDLDNTVSDYDSVQSDIINIVNKVTLPSLTSPPPQNVQNVFSENTFSNVETIWNPLVIAMVTIVFAFGTISLVLFGTKK